MSPTPRTVLLVVLAILLVVLLYVAGAWLRLYGRHLGPGEATQARIPVEVVTARERAQQRAAASLSPAPTAEILFGDLHVHTTFSTDAFVRSLPMMGGLGAHPIGEACDYARFCSGARLLVDQRPRRRRRRKDQVGRDEARRSAVQRGRRRTRGPGRGAPSSAGSGRQVGLLPGGPLRTQERDLPRPADEDEVPARAISPRRLWPAGRPARHRSRSPACAQPPCCRCSLLDGRQRTTIFIALHPRGPRTFPPCPDGVDTRELPGDCYECTADPGRAVREARRVGLRLPGHPPRQHLGLLHAARHELGQAAAPARMHDPSRQTLFEIYVGHGNSEEYRDWRAVASTQRGTPSAPSPRRLPALLLARRRDHPARCADDRTPTSAPSAPPRRGRTTDANLGPHLTVPGARRRGLARLRPVPRLLPALLQLPAGRARCSTPWRSPTSTTRRARCASASASSPRATTTPRAPARLQGVRAARE